MKLIAMILPAAGLALGMSTLAQANDLVGPRVNSSLPRNEALVTANRPRIDDQARWERVPGCARDIVAGANGVVYVTGCDVAPNSRASSPIYRWTGAHFVPMPVPGLGSALATFAGHSYTIGSDGLLYSSINDGEWTLRGTPDRQPITDVAVGKSGIWIVSSQPADEGGNTIYRARTCPSVLIGGGNDICEWTIWEGSGQRISVGDSVWLVNAGGGIFEWRNGSGQWSKKPGCFTDVAANNQHVYAVTCEAGQGDGNAIYQWDGAGSWVDVKGAGKRVAVDAAGNAWAITDSGEIWRRADTRVDPPRQN
ncbi:hypothetical protein [Arenimonas sp. MALMAid1274]|uniref:hypothetical protein n=1 Tax=Arenimonas sp. MALMAid1274 TaxID=3411630 RepID=UPI003B9EBD82